MSHCAQLTLTADDAELSIMARRPLKKSCYGNFIDDDDDDTFLVNDEAAGGPSSFKIIDRLGEGSFAYCVKLRHQETGFIFCGKVMPKRMLSQNQTRKLKKLPPETRLSLLKCDSEVDIHSNLFHPGIVEFHTWFCDSSSGKVCCILEYCKHGTLSDIAEQCLGKTIPQEAVQRWTHQLLSALSYLHSASVMVAHRDINPNNLLVDASLSLRLSDFGLASRLKEDGRQADGVMHASVGTLNYIAPEVVLKTDSDLRAADVWSCGVVMYQMLVGRVPFALQPDDQCTPSPQVPVVRQQLCAGAAEVIGVALRRDPNLRPTATSLAGHPFFASLSPSSCSSSGGGGDISSSTNVAAIDYPPTPQMLAADPSDFRSTSAALVPIQPQAAGGITSSLDLSALLLSSSSLESLTDVVSTPPPLQFPLGSLFLDPLADRTWIRAAEAVWVSIMLHSGRGRHRDRRRRQRRRSLSGELDDDRSKAAEQGRSISSDRSSESWESLSPLSSNELPWPAPPTTALQSRPESRASLRKYSL